MLAKMLEKELEARRLSVRAAAKEIGVSHTTIQRLLDGKNMDVPTMQAISNWLGISLADALHDRIGGDHSTSASMEALIDKEPRLAAMFDHVVAEVLGGSLSTEDLRDIIEYADFKLNQRSKRREPGGAGSPQSTLAESSK